jgi:hypothetical protein
MLQARRVEMELDGPLQFATAHSETNLFSTAQNCTVGIEEKARFIGLWLDHLEHFSK